MNDKLAMSMIKNDFNKTYNAKDKETCCSIEIKSNGSVYLVAATLPNGEKVSFTHHNAHKNYTPKLRDLIREKIEFSLDLSLEHLEERLLLLLEERHHLFNDIDGAKEVASSCINYMSDFPISSINEYIHEVRAGSENLVFANSVLKNGDVLSKNDREIISNELKEIPARFDFPEKYRELLSKLEIKINFLIENK